LRILHTADWHLGKTLEGRSRLPEQAQFMDELCELVEQEKIDIVLMAGDVYDTVNPPAEAEELFYDGITRLADYGRRKVVCIAGNHDHPERLAASTPLAEKQGIYLLGLPDPRKMLTIDVPSCNQQTKIFAFPYPSESRLKEVLSDHIAEEAMREAYDRRIAKIFQEQAMFFQPDTVNIAMSHLFVQGGSTSDSEREIQVGGAYTVSPESLPSLAQYVALGHLHRPQNVKHASTLARYSGSPLAYSFSEAGQTKSVTLLEIHPNQAPRMQEIYLRSGKPLVIWEAKEGVQQVYQWLNEGRDHNAWIHLEIHLNDSLAFEEIHRLRKANSNFVNIKPIFPEMEREYQERVSAKLPIDELFRRFYKRQTNGAEPEPELIQLFLELVQVEEGDEECVPSA
jgi:exonuclease SbcD